MFDPKRLILLVIILLAFTPTSKSGTDSLFSRKKHQIKFSGIYLVSVAWVDLGYEFQINKRFSIDLNHFAYGTNWDNGYSMAFGSSKLGLKYYSKHRKYLLDDCYIGSYAIYRKQWEYYNAYGVQRVNTDIKGIGIALGKQFYILKWLSVELGYNGFFSQKILTTEYGNYGTQEPSSIERKKEFAFIQEPRLFIVVKF